MPLCVSVTLRASYSIVINVYYNDELESYCYTVKQMKIQMLTAGNKCGGREPGLSSY